MTRVYREFFLDDGSKVVLRSPRWKDLDDLVELINSLVEEGAPIARDKLLEKRRQSGSLAV